MTSTQKSAPAHVLADQPTRSEIAPNETIRTHRTPDGGVIEIHHTERHELPAAQVAAWDQLMRRLLMPATGEGAGDGS